MKTAREWQFQFDFIIPSPTEDEITAITQIQLDAAKAGMRLAAARLEQWMVHNSNCGFTETGHIKNCTCNAGDFEIAKEVIETKSTTLTLEELEKI